jgi:hypothetical protein
MAAGRPPNRRPTCLVDREPCPPCPGQGSPHFQQWAASYPGTLTTSQGRRTTSLTASPAGASGQGSLLFQRGLPRTLRIASTHAADRVQRSAVVVCSGDIQCGDSRSVLPVDEHHHQVESLSSEAWQALGQAAILWMIRQRKPVRRRGVAQSLDQFSESPDEIVGLLRGVGCFAFGFDIEVLISAMGLDIDAAVASPSDSDAPAEVSK